MEINNQIKIGLSTGIYSLYEYFHIYSNLFKFTIKPRQKQETGESRNSLVSHFGKL